MTQPIEIKLYPESERKFTRALSQFGRQIDRYIGAAGREISEDIILPTVGVMRYPPADEANQPGRTKTVTFGDGRIVTFRMGYYERGRGMFVPVRGGGYRLAAGSKRYGTQFNTATKGEQVIIGNTAPYAIYLGGEQQAAFMGARGWRKLVDVAREKLSEITRRYENWVEKLIRDVGLK